MLNIMFNVMKRRNLDLLVVNLNILLKIPKKLDQSPASLGGGRHFEKVGFVDKVADLVFFRTSTANTVRPM
jgi:hypothetical protein